MKAKFYLTLLVLASFVTSGKSQTKNSVTLPSGVNDSWFQQASMLMKNYEYAVRKDIDQHYRITNSANRVGFIVGEKGYTAYPLQERDEAAAWHAAFSLRSIGRENGPSLAMNQSSFQSIENRLVENCGGFEIEYLNSEKGLRQNFILNTRPEGEGKLVLAISLKADLTARIVNGKSVEFVTTNNKNEVKLTYEDLKVWDARHEVINAHMELNEQNAVLSIIVDDKDAVYPLTVDPLNKVPEWTTSADGILPALLNNLTLQVQSLYGYTVVGVGDINGDNFDDIAISAPGMANVVSGTGSILGVGAVFVFLGSNTGVSATPAKVLQPTTTIGSILFGLSVAAGKISPDALNDIVVSAPLDQYQTAASVLFGTINVNVTAGKVYYYRSEDLLASSNPTPSVQIRLEGATYWSAGILGVLASNISAKPLFGYSLSVTSDLNNDGREDIIIGAPAYIGTGLLSVKSGAAYVYYSNNLATTSPVSLQVPDLNVLGLLTLPIANLNGLLFGFSVEGVGDYNGDNIADVVVSAPAGADLGALGGIFSGQFLGGSAYVYYGTGTNAGVTNTIGTKLQASPAGLLSNVANLFGYKIRAVRNSAGVRNGNILISAPAGGLLSNVVGGLRLKAGQVHVFTRYSNPLSVPNPVTSVQTLTSPRSSSLLALLAAQNLNLSVLYGADMDNLRDINCDGNADIIIGEPLSTNVPLIGANVTGGAAYAYLGKADGTYKSVPDWTLNTTVSALLGVNATSLIGWSVSGAGYTSGAANHLRAVVGGPTNSLDFGAGLLNLGNTIGVLTSFTFDNNGLGKAYIFDMDLCGFATLPTHLLSFKGKIVGKTVDLNWEATSEPNLSHYELERSTDGSKFAVIAIAFAKGQQVNAYNYPDKHPYFGINYYRLKMVDNDGKFTYSSIVTARFTEELPGAVVVAPNPVRQDLNLRLTGYNTGTYFIKLYSTSGQLVQTKKITVNSHDQTEVMNRNNSPAGVYWIMIYDTAEKKIGTVRVLFAGQ